ncbi:hypothetical protein [Chroococcidiopsis sp.]|uniref:hypothetical protein n=1 Tax=Chroococcidiopsis sp. TaxID=3088168 RepID=UPI003F33AA19
MNAHLAKIREILEDLADSLDDASAMKVKAVDAADLLDEHLKWMNLDPEQHPNLINTELGNIQGDSYSVECYVIYSNGNSYSVQDAVFKYISTEIPNDFISALAVKAVKQDLDRAEVDCFDVGVYAVTEQ